MTRDELHERLNDIILGCGGDVDDAMEHVDAYAATQRAEIEQSIEAQATEMQDGLLLGRDRGAEARSYLAAGMRMAAKTVREDGRHD